MNSHMLNTGLLQEAINRYSADINDLNAALNCGEVLGFSFRFLGP